MPWWGITGLLLGCLFLFTVLNAAAKNKRPVKRALLSMGAGAVTRAAVNLLSGLTGVVIPVSLLSVLVSLIGGIPGVTLILFLNML